MRSVLVVVAGFVVWSVIWLAAGRAGPAVAPDAYGEDGSVSSAGLLIVFLAVSVVCSLAGGWVAAKLSAWGAGRNVMVLALILLAVGIVVELLWWSLMPAWYHLIFVALLVPGTVAGGRLVRE